MRMCQGGETLRSRRSSHLSIATGRGKTGVSSCPGSSAKSHRCQCSDHHSMCAGMCSIKTNQPPVQVVRVEAHCGTAHTSRCWAAYNTTVEQKHLRLSRSPYRGVQLASSQRVEKGLKDGLQKTNVVEGHHTGRQWVRAADDVAYESIDATG